MKINDRLQFKSQQEEINLDKEVSEIACRIIEKVQQRQQAKSAQKEFASQYLRASDYKNRQLFASNQIDFRRESDRVIKGWLNDNVKKEEIYVPEFKISNEDASYDKYKSVNQQMLSDLKTPQKSSLKPDNLKMNSLFQKTVKNYKSIDFQEQNYEKMKQIQLINDQNHYIKGSTLNSNRRTSPQKISLIPETSHHAKSTASLNITQFQSPVASIKQQDIMAQLLGSSNHIKKNYVSFQTKR